MLGCSLCGVQSSPSSASSNWPSSPSLPSSSRESRGDVHEGDDTSGKGCGDTDNGRGATEGSACSPTGVSSHERKSRTGVEMGGVGAVKGVHLGGVGVRGGDDRTSLESAMSLAGSTAGTGGTRSALGVGQGVSGPRGVMVVEVLLSTDFVAKGEGAREFSCPLAAKRGGTEIQTFSFSLGMMMG